MIMGWRVANKANFTQHPSTSSTRMGLVRFVGNSWQRLINAVPTVPRVCQSGSAGCRMLLLCRKGSIRYPVETGSDHQPMFSVEH